MIRMRKIKTYAILLLSLLAILMPIIESVAEDDVMAMAEVKATFRKVVPRKINIGEVNLYIPEIEVGVPTTGIYTVQFDGGELLLDENGKESVSKEITLTIWLYIDVLEREPGIASVSYENLISTWDEKKGKLLTYSVEMPPYEAAYHVTYPIKENSRPYEVNIISPVGDNFMIKMSLSTNKENLDKDMSVKLAKDLLDYVVRRAIDVEAESIDNPEEKE